jgi:hypothetical protein
MMTRTSIAATSEGGLLVEVTGPGSGRHAPGSGGRALPIVRVIVEGGMGVVHAARGRNWIARWRSRSSALARLD